MSTLFLVVVEMAVDGLLLILILSSSSFAFSNSSNVSLDKRSKGGEG